MLRKLLVIIYTVRNIFEKFNMYRRRPVNLILQNAQFFWYLLLIAIIALSMMHCTVYIFNAHVFFPGFQKEDLPEAFMYFLVDSQ